MNTIRVFKRILAMTTVLAAAVVPAIGGQYPPVKHWEATYTHLPDGTSSSVDWLLAVRQTSDGGYLAGGFASSGCHLVPSLLKVNPHGEVLWHSTYYAKQPCGFGSFSEVLEVEDGYVASGRKDFPSGSRMFVVKVDFKGNVIWERVLNGIRPVGDPTTKSSGRAIRRAPDGGFIVAGGMTYLDTFGVTQANILLAKLDSEGLQKWAHVYDSCTSPGVDGDEAFAVTPIFDFAGDHLGYVFAGTGGASPASGATDVLIGRVDAAGEQATSNEWLLQIDSAPLLSFPGMLRVRKGCGPPKILVPYEKIFHTATACTPTPTYSDRADSVEQTRSGDLIVGGHFNRYAQSGGCSALPPDPDYLDGDGVLVKLSLDGDFDFVKNIAHCSGLDFSTVAREARWPESEGYIFSCTTADPGVVNPGHDTDMLLVETNPDGEIEWRRAFKGPGKGSCAFDMAVANDGGFIVVGNNTENADDYVLVKLYSSCQPNASFDIAADTEIQSAVTWNSSRKVKGSVTVKPGATLTITGDSTTIQLADTRQLNDVGVLAANTIPERAQLVVEPGGHLILAGATLQGLDECNGIWEGVQVLGDPTKSQVPVTNQGRLTASRATVRDAITGILTDRTIYNQAGHPSVAFSHPGGIVQMRQSLLLNNRKGGVFSPYIDPVRPHFNLSAFDNTTFDSDGFMRDPDYVTPDGRRVAVNEHLTLFGVRGVRVIGSTFRNSIPLADLDADIRGTGIGAFDASFTVREACVKVDEGPFQFPFLCPETHPTTFTDLTDGVSSGTILFDRRWHIQDAVFERVQRGVTSTGGYFDSLTDSTFDLPAAVLDLPVYAVLMDGASGFSLQRNVFGAAIPLGNEGVIVWDSGSFASRISDNLFSGTSRGLRALGANLGLDIYCNSFDQLIAGLVVGSGDLKPQGSGCGAGEQRADNTFGPVRPSLEIASFGNQVLYYENEPTTSYGAVSLQCLGTPPRQPVCPRTPPCVSPFCFFSGAASASSDEVGTTLEAEVAALDRIQWLLDQGRSQEAIDVLGRLETNAALELRIGLRLQRGEHAAARRLLDRLPEDGSRHAAFRRLVELRLRLVEEGRSQTELTEDERAQLRQLATESGRTGFVASRWLAMLGHEPES